MRRSLYRPNSINTETIDLTKDLESLVEQTAKNVLRCGLYVYLRVGLTENNGMIKRKHIHVLCHTKNCLREKRCMIGIGPHYGNKRD